MNFKKLLGPMGAGGASALLAFTSFLSYVAGLLRDKTIAYNFGTSAATDTYNASFLIPDMLFNLFIAGALIAAFMPIFSEYLEKNRPEAFSVANTVLTGASILISFIAVIAFIFMGSIIPAIFPNVDPEAQISIINMTRLMLPSALLFSISNTLGNVLMTYRKFTAFAISPVIYNIGIILGILLLQEQFGIYSAAIGVLIGTVFHLIVRILDIFNTDYRFKPELKLKTPGFKRIVKLMIPKSISLVAWQLNLYIFAVVGMRMIEGGLAAFNFARNIQSFAVSLFGIAFATAVFPVLNSAINNGDRKLYTHHVQTTIQRVLFFTVPCAIGVLLLAEPITLLILGGGQFDEKSVELTSVVLTFFALSIPLESLTTVFARSFYALKNTLTPMFINIISLSIIASITIFVAPKYGIQWFSIGFTIGFAVYNVLFITLLSRKLQDFKFKKFAESITKTAISTAVMGAGVYFTINSALPINKAISGIVVGGGLYLLTAYLIKAPEIDAVRIVFNKLTKKKNA